MKEIRGDILKSSSLYGKIKRRQKARQFLLFIKLSGMTFTSVATASGGLESHYFNSHKHYLVCSVTLVETGGGCLTSMYIGPCLRMLQRLDRAVPEMELGFHWSALLYS